MKDRFILLKIKREWSHDEAVKALQKIISDLQIEIGMLKSELEEAGYNKELTLFLVQENESLQREIMKIKTKNAHLVTEQATAEESKPKKAWLKDELIADINRQWLLAQEKSVSYKKAMEEWRSRYFNLLAKTSKVSNTHE